MHICQLILGYQPIRGTLLAGSSRTTRPMNEKLHFGGKVVMDDVFEEGNIDTSSSQISHKEHLDLLLPKLVQLVFSRSLVHGAVDVIS